MAKVHQTLARELAPEARAFARGHGGSTAHFAGTIYGRGSTKQAVLANRRQGNAAIWGAKKRTGWYGRSRYRNSRGRQHPEWVGNSWDVGGSGGPRGLNDAVRHEKPNIDKRYFELVDEQSKKAFPRGGLSGR